MILFLILAILTMAGLVFRQSALRFLASNITTAADGTSARFRLGAYLKWLAGRMKTLVSPSFPLRTWKVFNGWAETHYPGLFKWVFLGFAAGFIYLAGSGFFFAVFFRRGMFGIPLLAHVMAGGLFAVGLAAILLWRARVYRFDQDEASVFEAFACPIIKNLSKAFVRKILFWVFTSFGFVQVTTALGSMLPIFTYETQQALIMIHRFSALGLVLSAILFFDITLLEQPKTPPA